MVCVEFSHQANFTLTLSSLEIPLSALQQDLYPLIKFYAPYLECKNGRYGFLGGRLIKDNDRVCGMFLFWQGLEDSLVEVVSLSNFLSNPETILVFAQSEIIAHWAEVHLPEREQRIEGDKDKLYTIDVAIGDLFRKKISFTGFQDRLAKIVGS